MDRVVVRVARAEVADRRHDARRAGPAPCQRGSHARRVEVANALAPPVVRVDADAPERGAAGPLRVEEEVVEGRVGLEGVVNEALL